MRDDLGHRQNGGIHGAGIAHRADRLLVGLDERLAGPICRRAAADGSDDGARLHGHDDHTRVRVPAREPAGIVGHGEGRDVGRVLRLELDPIGVDQRAGAARRLETERSEWSRSGRLPESRDSVRQRPRCSRM